jgi:hypothetical protein
VSSELSIMVGEPRSINHLPNEILLKILSHFGPEELCFIIAEVCVQWNVLSKDVTLWKTQSYSCDDTADISRVVQVRCATLLVFRTNYLTNFAPSTVLKVQSLKLYKSISEFGPISILR